MKSLEPVGLLAAGAIMRIHKMRNRFEAKELRVGGWRIEDVAGQALIVLGVDL